MGYIDGENAFINSPKDEGCVMIIKLQVSQNTVNLMKLFCILFNLFVSNDIMTQLVLCSNARKHAF